MRIHTFELTEPFDLTTTLESGQNFQWESADDKASMFTSPSPNSYQRGISSFSSPTNQPEAIYVQQDNTTLNWKSTIENKDTAQTLLIHYLGLNNDLNQIKSTFPEDQLLKKSINTHSGLRVPNEDPFPTIISFICSSQMKINRIHTMQKSLSKKYGQKCILNEAEIHCFPSPSELSEANEEELRELKLGYRAEYVTKTTNLIVNEKFDINKPYQMSYQNAQDYVKNLFGVGNKVADCILLFGYGFTESIPLDTWIKKAVNNYYPHFSRSKYHKTSEALRDHFGPNAGIAQAYLFHYLRTEEEDLNT